MRTRSIIFFGLRFGLCYTLLYACYYLVRSSFSGFEPALLKGLAICVKAFLSLFGETHITYTEGIPSLSYLNYPVAELIPACNGHRVYILFLSLFPAAFPHGLLKKFKWILIGVLLLYAGNVLRIGLLALIYYYQNQWFPFIHAYIFQGVFYLMVMAIWYLSFKSDRRHGKLA